jgi:Tol biopolymer transport system component/DNA-binding winged helix-turn-helix (wHTH) protein
MKTHPFHVFLFDDVEVEPQTLNVLKAGREIEIEPKAFKVLLFLIENQGRLIEKSELLDAVWQDTHVTENALTREIAQLRRLLGDDPKAPRYIQTVHTRGYRFIAKVRVKNGQEITGSAEPERAEVTEPGNGAESASPVTTPLVAAQPTEARPSFRHSVAARWLALAGVLGVAATLAWKIYTKPASLPATAPLKIAQATSWSGLDVNPTFSPDGHAVAYSSDHSGSFEIYLKSLAPGGREIQLTADGGQNFDPAWSPDGERIAYYSRKRGGIWVMPALGGVAKQLTTFGAHPAWSRDGRMIAFQSASGPDLGASAMGASTICIVSSQGGSPQPLTRHDYPAGLHFAPSWSPDGKRIAFLNFDTGSSQVWTISVAGDGLKQITQPGTGDKISPFYSPDGESIYFAVSLALWKVSVSPQSGEPVGKAVKVADLGSTAIRHATLSADGRKLAYSAWTVANNLWAVSLSPATQEAMAAAAALTNEAGTRHMQPAFSPDGQRIAFAALHQGSRWGIWTMDADGHPTQITVDGGRSPSWYPDGQQLAFLSQRQGHRRMWSVALEHGKEQPLFELKDMEDVRLSPDAKQVAFNFTYQGIINVATIPIAGGQPKQLTFDGELAGWPCWSPDGRWLAFEVKRGDDTHIMIMPSGGGTPIQLTSDAGQSWPYSWSPDGDKIAFAGARDGVWNVWWVSRSNKTQRQLTHNTKFNAYVRFPAWSPRGDKIVYEYAETTGNIYVMDLK